MAGMSFRNAYEYDPETYGGEAGGLPGMMQRYLQQKSQQQQGVDFGRTPNGAPDYSSETSFSPQGGGLLGRLLSLQAEQGQYQPIPGNGGSALSRPLDPNFRQLSRVPIAARPQDASGSNSSDDQSSRAAQPERPFSDRLQVWWDQPDPHGMVAALKGGLNGIAQAVQGSIDATSTPSTEEEAFRQNQGRELGPVGAWKGASLLSPTTPGGTGGIFASSVVGALRDGLPWLPAGARVVGQGVHGPIIAGLDDRFPEAVSWLRNARTGDVPDVLSHPELGDRRVDLIFGKRGEHGYGVDHIDAGHPGQLDELPENWRSLTVKREGANRIRMNNDEAYVAVIRKDFENNPKNWLLTFYKENGDRPEGKLPDSASAQDRAVPFPDRPANSNIANDWQFLNAVRDPASSALSRTVSSAFGNVNPLNLRQAASPQASRPLGIVSGEPMPQWPFPPPIWAPRR